MLRAVLAGRIAQVVSPIRVIAAAALALVVLLAASPARAQCIGQWLPGFGMPVLNGPVHALAHWDPDGAGPLAPALVAGGAFTTAGGVSVGRIARWDGAAWAPFGTGMDNVVRALAVLPNGDLVAAGDFTTAGGLSAGRIARWDGAAWSPLGAGIDNSVYALAVLPNGDLMAGGNFLNAGGLLARRIARWDGTTWSPLGTGMDNPVFALTLLPGGDLVAGGNFFFAGDVPVNRIARWNGTTWSPVGSGMNAVVRALTVFPNGDLVAGGDFTTAGGMAVGRIARWNGAAWSPFGTGVDNSVYALAAMPNGDVVAGGDFAIAGGLSANRIARWNGAIWAPLGTGMNNTVYALAALPDGGFIVGGSFTTAGSVTANYIARRDAAGWRAFGGGMSSTVHALAVLPNGDVVAGGEFITAGGVTVNRIARWDGTAWRALGGGVSGVSYATVYALAVLPNGDLVAGGIFTTAGSVSASNIARWNGAVWSPLGAGFGSTVNALAILPNGDIVVGGFAGGTRRWNGTAWILLTSLNGLLYEGEVYALLALPTGGLLAGGSFTRTYDGTLLNRIAHWYGTAWYPLDRGLNGPVRALAILPSGDLVAGGDFAQVGPGGVIGDPVVNRIARWDGKVWHRFGPAMNTGMNGPVRALAVLPNGDLIAGGQFATAGGVSVSGIARWDGTAWSPLGAGVGSPGVNALAVLPGGDLAAGGGFTTAGGMPSNYFARWSQPTAPSLTQQPQPITTCPDGDASFSVATAGGGGGPVTYAWQIQDAATGGGWETLANGPLLRDGLPVAAVSGADGPMLAFSEFRAWFNAGGGGGPTPGRFRAVVTNACGSVESDPAELTVCPADFDCDGVTNIQDFVAYVSAFAAGDPRAEFTGDGAVTVQDFLAFLSAFAAGC